MEKNFGFAQFWTYADFPNIREVLHLAGNPRTGGSDTRIASVSFQVRDSSGNVLGNIFVDVDSVVATGGNANDVIAYAFRLAVAYGKAGKQFGPVNLYSRRGRRLVLWAREPRPTRP